MAIFLKKIPLNFVLHYLRRQLTAFEGSVKGVAIYLKTIKFLIIINLQQKVSEFLKYEGVVSTLTFV